MTADLRSYPEYKDSGLPWLGHALGEIVAQSFGKAAP